MGTETLDSMFNKPTDRTTDIYERDPFKAPSSKSSGISFVRIAIIIAVVVLALALQLIKPEDMDTSSALVHSWCAINLFCSPEETGSGERCVCQTLLPSGE